MNFTIVFIIISGLWVGSELLLMVTARSKKGSVDKDEGSIVTLNITIYSSVTAGVVLGFLGIGYIHGLSPIVPLIGLSLIIVGMIIRWTAIFTLKKYFTTNIVIQDDHKIIASGIYQYIRHPSYAGSLLSFGGLGLVFANWLSFIVLMVPISIVFFKRMKIEERALEQAFGEEYSLYRKSTWALFPGW